MLVDGGATGGVHGDVGELAVSGAEAVRVGEALGGGFGGEGGVESAQRGGGGEGGVGDSVRGEL